MANWNLSDIFNKIRLTTGRVDASMMSDATLLSYVNNFYQYVLPKEMKIFWEYTYFQFFTQANQDQYLAPLDFQTVNPQATVDGFLLDYYIDPDTFYQDFPQQVNKQTVAQGDGSTNSFSYTLSAFPITEGSLYVTDGTQVAQDNGAGGFVDAATGIPLSGTIDYLTATVTGQSFLTPPVANANIVATSGTYQAARPEGILYFKSQPLVNSTVAARDTINYFVLRPVPDQTYLIKMQGIQIPPAFTLTQSGGVYTDVPMRTDLGPLIAYGASLEIFADFNQFDQYDLIQVQYKRYKDVSYQDTYEQYLYQRPVPTF